MRPEQLTFSGLRSYPGRTQTLDFTGKSQVAILGDTGAGKTTILEAITLALYGASSWSGRVKELIAEGARSMTVDLTFSHEGHTWRIRRVYYANNRPSTHLLECLDTDREEKVDNRGAVNRRVEKLLKLRREEFQAAVLLPQGRFDRLLTAADAERAELLKGIFGTRSLEATRALAEQHRDAVQSLLQQAQEVRRGYLDDPGGTAKSATLAAQAAQHLADRLEAVMSRMSDLQATADRQARRLNDLNDAYRELSDTSSLPDATVLVDIAVIEQELTDAAEQLTDQEQQAKAQRARAQQRLDTATDQGVTADAVATAAAMLTELPARIAALQRTDARLSAEGQHLNDESGRLDREATRVEELERETEQLAGQASTAQERASRAVAAAATLEDATQAALSAAMAAAQTVSFVAAAASAHSAAQQNLPALKETLDTAQRKVQDIELELEAVTRTEAAHNAGQGLHAGDICTVCSQRLPDGYRAPEPADPARLAKLRNARSAADKGTVKAAQQLARGEATLETTERQLADADAERLDALRHLADCVAAAKEAAVSPDLASAPDGPAPGIDTGMFGHELEAATQALHERDAAASSSDSVEESTRRAEQLCAPARRLAQLLTEAATTAQQTAQTATTGAHSAAEVLKSRRINLAKQTEAHAAARAEYDASITSLSEALDRLPAVVGAKLPAPPVTITPDAIEAARRTLAELGEHINQASVDLQQADRDLVDIGTARLSLERRRQDDVAAPLMGVLTAATAHLGKVRTAQALLNPSSPRLSLPAAEQLTVQALQDICDTVAATTADILEQLRVDKNAAASDLAATHAKLAHEAQMIQADSEAGPLVRFAEDAPLHEPRSLDPLSQVIGAARQTHDEQTHLASRAAAQIEPARALDRAIDQGSSRGETLNVLYRQLADGKFIAYLTERRTRALLGVASELFSRLSSGRYGLTDNFRIVNLTTRTTRSPKTLSGGETFLASLALALALIELHSRSGARLGSLFLDEGFGALDSTALSSALSVLRTESGGDKLVVVISHLHAVAEAVDDVLWVQRTGTGSDARWLTDDQRDALVYDQAQSGLLGLAEH